MPREVQNSLRNDSREIDFRKSLPAKPSLISSLFRSPRSDGNTIPNETDSVNSDPGGGVNLAAESSRRPKLRRLRSLIWTSRDHALKFDGLGTENHPVCGGMIQVRFPRTKPRGVKILGRI